MLPKENTIVGDIVQGNLARSSRQEPVRNWGTASSGMTSGEEILMRSPLIFALCRTPENQEIDRTQNVCNRDEFDILWRENFPDAEEEEDATVGAKNH